MGRLIVIALRNLTKHKRRTALLGGAIALVTVLLVCLVGISRGMQETLLRSATTLITGHVNVGGFYKVTGNAAAPVVTDYEAVLDLVRAEVPDVDYVTHRLRGWGKIISDTSSIQSSFDGIEIEQEKGFGDLLTLARGSLDDLKEDHTALISEKQAERLEVTVGDIVTVSAPTLRGVNNSVDVRIVAIARDLGLLSQIVMFVDAKTVRDLYQLAPTATGAIMIYLKDRLTIGEVSARLRKALLEAKPRPYRLMDHEAAPFWQKFESVNREDWTGQKVDVTTWEDEISFISWTVAAFDVMSTMLVSILLIIIVIGIMNTLFMAIRERTGEIGTLRALGMPRNKVLLMFLLEAFLLSLFATTIGGLIGTGLASAINAADVSLGNEALQLFLMSDKLVLALDGQAIMKAIFQIVMTTTLFALLPSWRAARMKPVTAIHHAG